MMNRVPLWGVLAGFVAVFAAIVSLGYRYSVEQSNRAVGIMVEMPTVRAFAVAEGIPVAEALARLKQAGATGVAVQEQTVRQVAQFDEYSRVLNPGADRARVMRGIERNGPPLLTVRDRTGGIRLADPDDFELLLNTTIGLDPDEAKLVTDAGLDLIARHSNQAGYSAADVRDVLAESKALGATAYLPAGDAILGYRTAQNATVQALQENNLYYLTTEFSSFSGDRKVVAELPDRTIRLHAIQQAESDRNSPAATEERMVKAFAERNIRWLLLRPSSLGGEHPLTEFEVLIARIRQGVAQEKGAVRSPKPFAEPVVLPLLIPFLCAASLLAIAGVLLAFPLPRGVQIAALAVVSSVGISAAMGNAVGYLAFLVAVAAPMAAYAWWATRRKQPGFVGAIVMGAICIGGGLVVAGMLNDLPYYIQLKVFTGVKFAHFAPIAFVAILLLNRLVPLKVVAKEPMRYGPVVFGFIGLAVVAFMMSRTGNDSPTGVSGTELQLRSLLDAVLPVRPRTKEFMIGHPALVLGLMLLKRDPKSVWGSVLLGAGFIGLTSVVNTLCHLHSPLALNLTRIAVGAVLGLTLGLACWWLASALGLVRPADEQKMVSEGMGDQATT